MRRSVFRPLTAEKTVEEDELCVHCDVRLERRVPVAPSLLEVDEGALRSRDGTIDPGSPVGNDRRLPQNGRWGGE